MGTVPQPSARASGDGNLFSIPHGAQRLGVSERWLWNEIRAGRLPVVALGRRRLIRPSDLEAFIAARVTTGGRS